MSARYFAKHGHAPSDKLLLAVAEAPTLTAEQVAALAPTARALHEAEQANVLIGKVDARALHEAALATAVVDCACEHAKISWVLWLLMWALLSM